MFSPTDNGKAKKRNWFRWLGTAISAGLFIWLLIRQNWQQVWLNIRALPAWALLAALLLYFLGIILNAVRWRVILGGSPIKVPTWDVIRIVFLGSFVSNFLPSTIGGDAVRIISLMRYTTENAIGVTSVILDRAVNVAAMLTVLPFSFVTFGSPFAVLRSVRSSGQTLLFLGAYSPKGGLVNRAFRKSYRFLSRWREAFNQWLQHPWVLVLAFIISWLSVFVIFLAVYTLARGLAISVALYQVMGVTAITYLITMLPISVNGYGVREVMMTALYMYLGATVEQASTLAIVSRFMMLAVTLPGALWFPKVFSETVSVKDAFPPGEKRSP